MSSFFRSGRSRRGAWGALQPPPLFLDQTEARIAEKIFETAPPPLSQGLDDPSPPLGSATVLSHSL